MPTTRFLLLLLLLGNLFMAYRPLQAQHLYFLMAHSEDLINDGHPDYKTTFPQNDSTKLAILFKYTADSLQVVDTVNFDWKRNSKIKELRHFDDFRFFFMEEEENFDAAEYWAAGDKFFERQHFISTIDYSSDTLIIRKANRDSLLLDFVRINGPAFIQNGYPGYIFSVDPVSNLHSDKKIINKNLHVSGISIKNYLDSIYISTEAGYFLRIRYGLPYNKQGKLVQGFDRTKVNEWLEVLIHPPYNERDGKYYKSFSYLVKKPDFRYLIGHKEKFGGGTDSLTTYYTYNKTQAAWDSITIPYRIAGMNTYGDCLAYGALIRHKRKGANEKLDMRYTTKFGAPMDNGSYLLGKFYIYNVCTNQFSVFASNEIDTELLLLHDGWVYLRQFDTLKRVKLSNLKADLDESKMELLFKDLDIVPNIHHMFITPKALYHHPKP